MSALNDVPRSSEEWRAFLQSRVSGFGRILALFVIGFYVFSNSAAMLNPLTRWADWINLNNTWILISGAIPAFVWVICRSGERSTSALEMIDSLATIATGAAIGITCIYAPAVQRPELGAIMGVAIFIILRAILIPSSGARTAVLSILSVLPAIWAAYECHAREAPAPYKLPLPVYPALVAVWGGLGVTAASLASRTIFGLRQKASQAQKLGQYTLGAKIGEGGMGAVYRASHAMMKREVAIKLLPADKAGKESLVRFEREVQLTSRLNSPNTIAIFDYGRTPQGVFYYVMEYIDGFSLEDLVAKFGPLPPGRVIHLAKQICAALSEAHSIGLIHRDIKPANVALCERAGVYDVVKVLDFGLVKELGTDSSSTTSAALTGTPLYLSPEAITAPDKVDGRSDLYAVGGVVFWLLTGTHVFDGSTIVEVCSHHLHTKPESATARLGRSVPGDLEAVIARCLEKDPTKRYPSAEELAHALDACESVDEWSDALAAEWWQEHRAEADEARPKISGGAKLPEPIAVDLEGRQEPA